jgi:ABC-2 type transport system ATP-binding protein
MIRIDNVTKRFGDKTAVDGLTLHVPAGEVFAFLGRNGAGKTTTIKMITGLLRPTSGRVFVGGLDVQERYLEARQIIGYVPDQPYLYDKLSGREFLSMVGSLYGMNGDALEAGIGRMEEWFEMGDFLDELTETYSHGMKQRVVLAATLLHKPRLLVVDEPLVGLDPQTARLVKRIFRQEAAAGGAVFMSTHVLSIAEEVADRVGIVRDGRLAAVGTVEELMARGGGAEDLEEAFMRLAGEQGG